MSEPKGQILPDSAFGKVLTQMALRSKFILEVGTWHGLGSTLCLANGLGDPNQRFWTIEKDIRCYEEAKSYYTDPRITFLLGETLQLLDQIPTQIDLLLLDGDDLSTDAEFDALWRRCRVIALDDTNERKNRRQVQLMHLYGWTAVACNRFDRNGWAVFER